MMKIGLNNKVLLPSRVLLFTYENTRGFSIRSLFANFLA